MNKIGYVMIVVGIVVALYLILLTVMPTIVNLSITANTTIAGSGVDIAAMPGSTDMLILAPWLLWFVPGVIGMIAIVVILKSP